MNATKDRIAFWDALRGFCAFYVVAGHARSDLWSWQAASAIPHSLPFVILNRIWALAQFGHLAVMLFFILSGFCIHLRYAGKLARSEDSFTSGRFFLRRFLRIYPPFLLALLFTLICDVVGCMMNPAFYQDRGFIPSLSMILGNVVMLQGIVVDPFGSNTPLWSLSFGALFYLLYPLYYRWNREWTPGICLFILSVLTTVSTSLQHFLPFWAVSLIPYWFVWSLGAYLADIHTGRATLKQDKWRIVLSASMATIAVSANSDVPRVLDLVWSMLFAAALYVWNYAGTLKLTTLVNQGLHRVFGPVAPFSYSLYLLHSPVFALVSATWLKSHADMPASYYLAALFTPVCLLVGWLGYLLVEKRFS